MADDEDYDVSCESVNSQPRQDDEDSVYSFHSVHNQNIFPWALGNCFGSNVVWVTLCSTILLLFVLTVYVSQVKMAPKNVPYIYLTLLMLFSMLCQIYCFFHRKEPEIVRYLSMQSRATDFYIMAGLYLFGAGTLLSIALKISLYIHSSFLLYNCFSQDNHAIKVDGKILFHVDGNASQNHTTSSPYITGGYCYMVVAYDAFRILFVLLQVGFIHSFRHAVFLQSSRMKFILSQTLLTNLCIWFKYVSDETGLFGDKEKEIPNTDQFVSTVEQFKERLNPFILEFSLIAAGIFTSIASKMQAPLSFPLIGQIQQIPGERNDNENVQQRRTSHPGTQPGFLIGAICALFSVALGLTFGNSNNRFSEKSKAFYLAFESFITIAQSAALILMIYKVVEHRNEDDIEQKLDYYLLSVAYFGTLVFDFTVLYGVSISISRKSKLKFDHSQVINPDQPRDDIMILISTLLLTIFHPLQMVAITGYFRRFGPEQQRGSAGLIRQCTLFLIVSNIGVWAVDSFIEIRNHARIPYHSASHFFTGWDTVLAMSFPFCVFFRFHSALLLFEFWQRFKFS